MGKIELNNLRTQCDGKLKPIKILGKDYYVLMKHPSMSTPGLPLRDRVASLWFKIKNRGKPIIKMARMQKADIYLF